MTVICACCYSCVTYIWFINMLGGGEWLPFEILRSHSLRSLVGCSSHFEKVLLTTSWIVYIAIASPSPYTLYKVFGGTRHPAVSPLSATLYKLHYASLHFGVAYNSAPSGLRSPSSFSPLLPQPPHPIVPALASPIGRARLKGSDSTDLICSPPLRYGWRFCVPFHVPDFPAPHSVCYLHRYGFTHARFSAHLSTVSIWIILKPILSRQKSVIFFFWYLDITLW